MGMTHSMMKWQKKQRYSVDNRVYTEVRTLTCPPGACHFLGQAPCFIYRTGERKKFSLAISLILGFQRLDVNKNIYNQTERKEDLNGK